MIGLIDNSIKISDVVYSMHACVKAGENCNVRCDIYNKLNFNISFEDTRLIIKWFKNIYENLLFTKSEGVVNFKTEGNFIDITFFIYCDEKTEKKIENIDWKSVDNKYYTNINFSKDEDGIRIILRVLRG